MATKTLTHDAAGNVIAAPGVTLKLPASTQVGDTVITVPIPVVLPHFLGRINDQQTRVNLAPVVWMDFGDSMATQTDALMQALRKSLGVGGYALGSCLATLSAGASVVEETGTKYWINERHYAVPAGESVIFGFDIAGGTLASVQATTLKAFYIAENSGAGVNTFKFQYSADDGSTWNDIGGTIDTHNAGGTIGAAATTTRALGRYRVRVLGVAGTCKVIGAALIDDGNGGIVWARTSRDSLTLSAMLAPATAITQPIIAALAPAVFSYAERQEPPWDATMLETLRSRGLTASAAADWVWQSMTPVDPDDQDNAAVISTNATTRAYAVSKGDYFFDAYSAVQSWARLSGADMDANSVHLNTRGNQYLVSRWLAETGVLAVPSGAAANLKRRTLSNGQQIIVSIAGETIGNELVMECGKTSGGALSFYDADGTYRANMQVAGSAGFGGGAWWSPGALTFGVVGLQLQMFPFSSIRRVYLGEDNGEPREQLTVQKGISAEVYAVRTSLHWGSRDFNGSTQGPIDAYGAGTPEGVVAAKVGSTFRRTDGGAATSFYVKESGDGTNTGWVAK